MKRSGSAPTRDPGYAVRLPQVTPGRVALPVIASAVDSVGVLLASLPIERADSEAQQSHSRNLVVFTLQSLAVWIAGALLVLASRRRVSTVFKIAATARCSGLLRVALSTPWVERRRTVLA